MEIVYDMTGAVILRKDDGTEVDLLKLEGALTLAQRSREFNRRRVIELEDEVTRLRKILAGDGGLSDRLYTAAEVGDLQASEAELVAAPLRRANEVLAEDYARSRKRVIELEKQLAESRELVDFKNKLLGGNTEDKARLRDKVREKTNRVAELERTVTRRVEEIEELETKINSLEKSLAESQKATALFRDRVADLERQLARSIDRENKLEADAAEEREMNRRSIAVRDDLLAAATTRVEKARNVLANREVTEARDAIVTTKGGILADAIGRALGFLTSPVSEQE